MPGSLNQESACNPADGDTDDGEAMPHATIQHSHKRRKISTANKSFGIHVVSDVSLDGGSETFRIDVNVPQLPIEAPHEETGSQALQGRVPRLPIHSSNGKGYPNFDDLPDKIKVQIFSTNISDSFIVYENHETARPSARMHLASQKFPITASLVSAKKGFIDLCRKMPSHSAMMYHIVGRSTTFFINSNFIVDLSFINGIWVSSIETLVLTPLLSSPPPLKDLGSVKTIILDTYVKEKTVEQLIKYKRGDTHRNEVVQMAKLKTRERMQFFERMLQAVRLRYGDRADSISFIIQLWYPPPRAAFYHRRGLVSSPRISSHGFEWPLTSLRHTTSIFDRRHSCSKRYSSNTSMTSKPTGITPSVVSTSAESSRDYPMLLSFPKVASSPFDDDELDCGVTVVCR